MARKPATTTVKRVKKAATLTPDAASPKAVIEAQAQAPVHVPKVEKAPIPASVANAGAHVNKVAVKAPTHAVVNVQEEIRRRAYELYLQRRAVAGHGHGNGSHSGDENQDWLIAEREILSVYGNKGYRGQVSSSIPDQHSA